MSDSVLPTGSSHHRGRRALRAFSCAPGLMAAGLLGLLSLPGPARAELPAAVEAQGYALAPVGRGKLSLFGFRIYEASLWTPDGAFDGYDREPVALSLWYERRFTSRELVDIVDGQWQRLASGSAEQRRAWRAAVGRLWHDVERGDNLTAVVIPGRETLFFDRDRLLGRVDDPAFGPAYLGIWLHPRSAVRDLRVALLGTRERD